MKDAEVHGENHARTVDKYLVSHHGTHHAGTYSLAIYSNHSLGFSLNLSTFDL